MPRCVFFDLDGTLTDPGEGIVACLRFAFEGMGLAPPPDAALAAEIGPPLTESLARHLPDPTPAAVARALALYRERFDATGWRENRLLPQATALLEGVARRGWRAALATSKPAVFAERIVRHFGLDAGLAAVHGSELDGRRVDKPALLAHALAAEAVPAGRALMVGDRRHDVAGARAVGMASLGVTWGYGTRAELEAAGADWVCDDAAAALEALDRWALASGSPAVSV